MSRARRGLGWLGLAVLALIVAGAAVARYGLPWDSQLSANYSLWWGDILSWQGVSAQDDRPQPLESSVPKRRAVAALGRIEPHTEVIDLGASSPGLVDALLAEEGQHVAKGEILGYLDSYRERIAERDEQAARLDEARAMLAAEVALGEAEIAAVEIRVRQVEEIYPLRIEAQQARIALLTAELDNNREILDDRLTLQRRAVGSQRTVDDQRTLVRKNEEELAIARAELSRLQAEQRMEMLAATTELRREKAAVERARVAVGLASIEKNLALAEARAARAVIRAPMEGQILKIVTWPGERISEAPILQMGDARTMHVVAEVYESDVHLVRIGQAATISSPSLADDLTGRVVRIGRLIFKNDVLDVDPAADADARVVEVRIELDDGERVQNLSNMTVDVMIEVEDRETVADLALPARP